jgi:hypothetical protein
VKIKKQFVKSSSIPCYQVLTTKSLNGI